MIQAIGTHGETMMVLEHTILVASKTEQGGWHTTTVSSCSCKGAQYRGTCRHQKALRDIAAEAIERYAPATGTEQTERAAERQRAIDEFNDDVWGR
jgi:hypothetical protein